MKQVICLLCGALLCRSAVMGQEKRPPGKEIDHQAKHVTSSVNDLLHGRFKQAHEKHVAEMNRRNRGIEKDLKGEGQPLPKPAAPPGPPKIKVP